MKGIIYALLAAVCNSSIGIFSIILIEQGMYGVEIAFWRCFVAFLFTFVLCIADENIRKDLKLCRTELLRYAILAFMGINIMYLFETTAIQYIPVSLVSFLLYASGILTIILSCLFLREQMNMAKLIAIVLVVAGIGIMFVSNMKFDGNLIGILFAIIAGTGYSLYIFLNKKWEVQSGMRTLLYIFAFGTVFLGLQVFANCDNRFMIKAESIPFILLLAVIPTIGGFYFTNKAINYAAAGEVQLVEMSEPFIATILGYVFLNQMISYTDFVGGVIIVLGLLILEKDSIFEVLVLLKKS